MEGEGESPFCGHHGPQPGMKAAHGSRGHNFSSVSSDGVCATVVGAPAGQAEALPTALSWSCLSRGCGYKGAEVVASFRQDTGFPSRAASGPLCGPQPPCPSLFPPVLLQSQVGQETRAAALGWWGCPCGQWLPWGQFPHASLGVRLPAVLPRLPSPADQLRSNASPSGVGGQRGTPAE